MKTKTFLLLCLFLGIGMTQLSAQTLKKGAVISVSTYKITLQPGVTMNQYEDFMINKYLPEYEKNFPDSKMYILTGDRGEKKDQMGIMWYFVSVKVRDKYYPNETDLSTEAMAAWERMNPIITEESKYVSESIRVYTDWVIK